MYKYIFNKRYNQIGGGPFDCPFCRSPNLIDNPILNQSENFTCYICAETFEKTDTVKLQCNHDLCKNKLKQPKMIQYVNSHQQKDFCLQNLNIQTLISNVRKSLLVKIL